MKTMVKVFLVSLCMCGMHTFARAEKPNIIFILADDLGYGEVGCFGQKVIKTPNLDRMATEGMRFTQFYAGATVCAPSRSVLMTGKHHGHTRVRGNAGRSNPAAQALQPGDVTVAQALNEAGYATALIGKWGLGDVGEADTGLPGKHGFDYFFGILNQHRAHNHFTEYVWRNEDKVPLPNDLVPVGENGGGYSTNALIYADDLFADEALKYVARHQHEPFFLYWSMIVPHANNERTRALKNGAEVPDFGPYAGEDWPDPDKGQAAMITRLDSYVGRMLEQLKQLGLVEKTLIIFTSDNGPHNESNHNLKRFEPSGPLTGIKRSLTEGGIRVPTIMKWPGTIGAGTTSDHLGYFGDFFATACDLAGAKTPGGLDSISFVPTITGKGIQQEHEYLYWEFHEQGTRQSVRFGDWAAIREPMLTGPVKLYNLKDDLAEKHDLASAKPEVLKKAIKYLDEGHVEDERWPVKFQ
jgi:arylsulfatase A-like enzyme